MTLWYLPHFFNKCCHLSFIGFVENVWKHRQTLHVQNFTVDCSSKKTPSNDFELSGIKKPSWLSHNWILMWQVSSWMMQAWTSLGTPQHQQSCMNRQITPSSRCCFGANSHQTLFWCQQSNLRHALLLILRWHFKSEPWIWSHHHLLCPVFKSVASRADTFLEFA